MDVTLLILVAMVLTAVAIAFWKGGWQLTLAGFKQAVRTFRSMWIRLLLGLTLGGLIQTLVPSDLVADWLGPASGLKGILIGSYAGIIIGGGGPYVSLPVIASIYAAGAGVGPIIALLASMNLLAVQGLFTWQIPFLGAGIPLARSSVSLFIPPFVGLAGSFVYQLLVTA